MAGPPPVTTNSIVGFGVVNKWDKPTIELIVEGQAVVGTALGWPAVRDN